jgi:hypothetical protein
LSLRRRGLGEAGTAAAATGLIVAMFLPWYGLHGGVATRFALAVAGQELPPIGTGWQVLSTVRILLFALALLAFAPWALTSTGQRHATGHTAGVVAGLGTGVFVVLLAKTFGALGDPIDLRPGAFLGLGATAAIVLGALVTWRDVRGASAAEADLGVEPPAPQRARRGAPAAAFVVVLLLGGFVHFFRLGTSSWNVDEYFYGLVGDAFLHGDFRVGPGPHPYIGAYLLGLVPSATGSFSTTAVRIAPALAGMATGVVLFFFARRVAGARAGVIALALWLLLPHATVIGGAPFTAIRLERFGLLDPFMELFVAAALYAGWRWSEQRSWRWAAAAGACAGLATASKFVGALVVVPLAALAFVTPGRDRTRAAQTGLAFASCALSFALSFAPVLTDASRRVHAMLDLARANEAAGHATTIAGKVYFDDPPWWANAWFMGAGMGWWVSLALAASAMAGATLLERRLAIYLVAAVLVPAVGLAGFYGIALPHYFYLWLAPLTLLAALGLDELFRRARRGRVAAVALAVPLVIGMGTTVHDVASLRPADYRTAATMVRQAGLAGGNVAVVGWRPVLCAYLPRANVTAAADRNTEAIIIDPVQERRGDAFKVGEFLGAHRSDFVAARANRLRVFIRRGPPSGSSARPTTASPLRCFAQ